MEARPGIGMQKSRGIALGDDFSVAHGWMLDRLQVLEQFHAEVGQYGFVATSANQIVLLIRVALNVEEQFAASEVLVEVLVAAFADKVE